MASMDKASDPEEYHMTTCPVCDGYGLIRSSDNVEVCQNCGGFGFIKSGGKSFDSCFVE